MAAFTLISWCVSEECGHTMSLHSLEMLILLFDLKRNSQEIVHFNLFKKLIGLLNVGKDPRFQNISGLSEVWAGVCASQTLYNLCFLWICRPTAMFPRPLKQRLHSRNTLEHIILSVSTCCSLATKSRLPPTRALYQSSTAHCFSQQQVWIKNLHRAPTVSPCATALPCDIKGSKQLLRNIRQYVSTVAFIMKNLHISCSPCCLPYHLRLLPFFCII